MALSRLKPKLSLKSLRPIFTKNLGLKIFSFGCALAIYAFVHGTQDAQRSVSVDLVVLLPADSTRRIMVTPLPTSVRVTLRGPQSLIDGLHPEDLGNLEVDLRSGRSGRIRMEPSMLSIPPGVSITVIDPPVVDIAWDDVFERDVPIQVSLAGEPAEGVVINGTPEINPRSIHARGPRGVAEALQFVHAEPFDVTGLSEGTHRRLLGINPPPPLVVYDTLSINVTVEITRRMMERTFRQVQVHVVGAPHALAYPARVDVRIVGPPDTIKPLRQEQIVPRIDLKMVGANLTSPNSVALPLTIEIEGCKTFVTPSTVVVKW